MLSALAGKGVLDTAGKALGAALNDSGPMAATSGGNYASGPFVVGPKVVGRGRADAGAVSGSQAAQAPAGAFAPLAPHQAPGALPSWVVPAGVAAVVIVLAVILTRGRGAVAFSMSRGK